MPKRDDGPRDGIAQSPVAVAGAKPSTNRAKPFLQATHDAPAFGISIPFPLPLPLPHHNHQPTQPNPTRPTNTGSPNRARGSRCSTRLRRPLASNQPLRASWGMPRPRQATRVCRWRRPLGVAHAGPGGSSRVGRARFVGGSLANYINGVTTAIRCSS